MISFTNNNITYTLEIPPYPVNLFVDHYVFMKGNGLQLSERLFPNNKTELFFNLGDKVPGKSDWNDTTPDLTDAVISGVRHTYFDFFPPADFCMAGLRFTLFGFYELFKIPACHFTDNNFSARDVWGKEIPLLHERLREAHGCKQMFSILNEWITSRLSKCSLQEITVWSRMEKMLADPTLPVSELLSSYMGYSHKHSIRLMKDQSGLPPKDIKKIIRFDQALKAISQAPVQSWSGFAYASGYADQSHLIRDFRYFTGYTPVEYLTMKPHEYFFHELVPDQS